LLQLHPQEGLMGVLFLKLQSNAALQEPQLMSLPILPCGKSSLVSAPFFVLQRRLMP
jgi:hypothetical protein